MASIVIAGDTSGTCTISAPAVAGTPTLTLPTTSGTVLTSASSVTSGQLPTGSVLQVVQNSVAGSGTVVTTTSTSYATTGLSATITPKFSTSKILVSVAGANWDTQNAGYQIYGTVYRNSTNIGSGSTSQLTDVYSASGRGIFPICIQKLDSPATTSATTYTLYFFSGGGGNSVVFNSQGGTGIITLMEIAA
jgi:hypothetical protein